MTEILVNKWGTWPRWGRGTSGDEGPRVHGMVPSWGWAACCGEAQEGLLEA